MKRTPSIRWRLVVKFAMVAAILTNTPSLVAHHGLARFDTTHVVAMQGTITDFQWINPHAYVYADLTDAHGKIANWALECGSLAMLSRFGWSSDVLKRGDKVKVEMSPYDLTKGRITYRYK